MSISPSDVGVRVTSLWIISSSCSSEYIDMKALTGLLLLVFGHGVSSDMTDDSFYCSKLLFHSWLLINSLLLFNSFFQTFKKVVKVVGVKFFTFQYYLSKRLVHGPWRDIVTFPNFVENHLIILCKEDNPQHDSAFTVSI